MCSHSLNCNDLEIDMTDAEAMLEDCLKRYSKLNDYERGVIDTINDHVGIKNINHEQYNLLEKIWERVT